MIGYLNGEKLITESNLYIPNPNLIQQSKSYEICSYIYGENFKMGQSFKTVPQKATQYVSCYSTSNSNNWGVKHENSTTFVSVMPNTTYTASFWIKSSIKPKDNLGTATAQSSINSLMSISYQLSVKNLGNDEYKFYGTFTTPNTTQSLDFDVAYLRLDTLFDLTSSFDFCFEKIKLEYGSRSTDWTPSPEELVTQSDLDDLKSSPRG